MGTRPLTASRAGVVVIREGRIALIERRRDGRHYRVVPGGSIEPGESVDQAALREAREELHTDVALGRLVIEADFPGGTDTPVRHRRARRAMARRTGTVTDLA